MKFEGYRRVASIGLVGLVFFFCSCAVDTVKDPSVTEGAMSTSKQADSSAIRNTGSVRLKGLLTLKGSEVDAWWALMEGDGQVWRLEPLDPRIISSFRLWQNSQVEVFGERSGIFLSTPMIKVIQAKKL